MFFKDLGKSTKVKAILHLKNNVVPLFKPKRSVPFTTVEPISKELDRLGTLGVTSSTNYSEWAFLHV